MRRRRFLQSASALALSAPGIANAQAIREKTLRVVPLTALFSLDTVFNTSLVTTNHGFAVYDTLFGLDNKREIKPQMAEGYTVSDDGRTYTIKLREGLKFHDGEPVRARDAIQSLKRWAGRETFGQTVAQFVDSWNERDDRTMEVKLTRRVPIFIEAIGRGSASVPFVMPERVAKTDPFKQITEAVGSGPFKFLAGEFAAGSFAAYERNRDYVPRAEPAEWSSGGKHAHFDRVELRAIPEPATAAAALLSGEVDWYEQVQPDLIPQLRRGDVNIANANPTGFNGILRFNHLHPPFDNVLLRRAVMMAVNQADYMASITGNDPTAYNDCKAMFPCGTPYGAQTGAAAMAGDLAKATAMAKASGYKGERIVVLSPADVPTIGPMGDVTYDLLKRMGLNVELAAVDWATLTQRRASKEPVEKGGWSIFHTWAPSQIISTPVEHFPMRGLGATGWAGWYDDKDMEQLTRDWTAAETAAEQVRLAAAIQARAFEQVPYVLCGQFQIRTATRKYLTGLVTGGAAYMWNLRRV
jgi:peptide/nickel transport system substrate-binding protein